MRSSPTRSITLLGMAALVSVLCAPSCSSDTTDGGAGDTTGVGTGGTAGQGGGNGAGTGGVTSTGGNGHGGAVGGASGSNSVAGQHAGGTSSAGGSSAGGSPAGGSPAGGSPAGGSPTGGNGTAGGGATGIGGSSGGPGAGGAATGGGQGVGGGTAGSGGDSGCGYEGKGMPLHVADGIDLCLPAVTCTSETCPPPLGDCVAGACVFKAGYSGLGTLPEAWVTYYCTLSTGGCHGVTQIDFPEKTAAAIAMAKGIPLCEDDPSGDCVGIAASSPMLVGNSQVAIDPMTGQTVSLWGLGLTEASGLCYELTGPGGTVTVALTDRCGGYCSCGGSGFQECGPCVSAPDMKPNCPCVGTAPALYTECCGNGCGTTKADCDWCASNNHPHFDLDTGSFNKICAAGGVAGSCKLSGAKFVPCVTPSKWPPGGGGGTCKANSFQCSGPMPNQPQVPGTNCCCNFGLMPQPDGTCQ